MLTAAVNVELLQRWQIRSLVAVGPTACIVPSEQDEVLTHSVSKRRVPAAFWYCPGALHVVWGRQRRLVILVGLPASNVPGAQTCVTFLHCLLAVEVHCWAAYSNAWHEAHSAHTLSDAYVAAWTA